MLAFWPVKTAMEFNVTYIDTFLIQTVEMDHFLMKIEYPLLQFTQYIFFLKNARIFNEAYYIVRLFTTT